MKRVIHSTIDPTFKYIVDHFEPDQIEFVYSCMDALDEEAELIKEGYSVEEDGSIKDDYLLWLDDYNMDQDSFDKLYDLMSKVDLNKIEQFLIEQGIILQPEG